MQQLFLATGLISNEMGIINDEQIHIAQARFKSLYRFASISAAYRTDKGADKSF